MIRPSAMLGQYIKTEERTTDRQFVVNIVASSLNFHFLSLRLPYHAFPIHLFGIVYLIPSTTRPGVLGLS